MRRWVCERGGFPAQFRHRSWRENPVRRGGQRRRISSRSSRSIALGESSPAFSASLRTFSGNESLKSTVTIIHLLSAGKMFISGCAKKHDEQKSFISTLHFAGDGTELATPAALTRLPPGNSHGFAGNAPPQNRSGTRVRQTHQESMCYASPEEKLNDTQSLEQTAQTTPK